MNRSPASYTPSVLGLRPSFGFGDRLGLAGPGHLAALGSHPFAPILAQQSIRELARTNRTADEVMTAAQNALAAANYEGAWGADADHLKTREDIIRMVNAGYTFFTLDPSAKVRRDADDLSPDVLANEVAAQNTDRIYADTPLDELYLGQSWEIAEDFTLRFDQLSLHRAAVKYGRALQLVDQLHQDVADVCSHRPFELEVSVDETDTPTTPLEHLFFALELRRRGVVVVSLAPRFVGEFEKGIDYKGDMDAFTIELRKHVAIAKAMGPYKISVHSGSDKFSIYPILGRECGDLIHVKTAGTSYLEALRAICRVDPALFGEIACYALERFDEDRATYHISVTPEFLDKLTHQMTADLEETFLNHNEGRQVMHVTFGSVLTMGQRPNGQPFKEAILDLLRKNEALHTELLTTHLGKHLRLLRAG